MLRDLCAFPVLALIVAVPARSAAAQETRPIASLEVGAGNLFGGLGIRGTAFGMDGRLALAAGLGVFAGSPGRDPILGAAALRYYVNRGPHGLYAGIFWSPLHAYSDDDLQRSGQNLNVLYGPGLAAGYRLSFSQFFVTAGAGVGRTRLGNRPIVELAIGRRWLRTTPGKTPPN